VKLVQEVHKHPKDIAGYSGMEVLPLLLLLIFMASLVNGVWSIFELGAQAGSCHYSH
jgi:hypothetical protein